MNAPRLPIIAIQGDVATTTARLAQVPFLDAAVLTDVIITAETAVAASATVVYTLTVTNRGSDDTGTVEVAKITNDTDVTSSATADDTTLVEAVLGGTAHASDPSHTGAIASNVATRLSLSGRDNPLVDLLGYGYTQLAGAKIAAGDVLEVNIVGSAGLSLDEATVTLVYRPGSN